MMGGSGDVQPRYCNRCGQEEHGTAGCHVGRGIVLQDKVHFPAAVYRLVGGELFRVDFVNLPPSAKPFRLPRPKE